MYTELMKQYVYAIFGSPVSSQLDELVPQVYPENSHQLISGQWLIRDASSLPADVYKKIQDLDNTAHMVIVRVAQYYGYHDKATWDWIEASKNDQ